MWLYFIKLAPYFLFSVILMKLMNFKKQIFFDNVDLYVDDITNIPWIIGMSIHCRLLNTPLLCKFHNPVKLNGHLCSSVF